MGEWIGPIYGGVGGGGGGSGTVTSFTFTDANGIHGVVTNPTTAVGLTLSFSPAGTARASLRVPALASVQAASDASIGNINIAAPGATLDGFTFLSSGFDTFLLTAQTIASQNGPWVWNGAATPATRPTDWASGYVATTGRMVIVQNGGHNINTLWVIDVPSAGITVDTTAQTWVSLNILGTTFNEAVIRANPLNQLATATGNYPMGGFTLTGVGLAIAAGQPATFDQLAAATVFTASGTYTPPSDIASGLYLVICIGGGGGGGGGGTATSALSFQMGGGGGGQGECKQMLMTLAGGTAYTVTVGAAGALAAGGTANGHAGGNGGNGGNTTFAGPTNLIAAGGSGGTGGTASTANGAALGAFPGAYAGAGSVTFAAASAAGNGGTNFLLSGVLAAGLAGGGAVGFGAGGGGGGGGASASLGGAAGKPGSYTTAGGGLGGGGGGSGTTTGVTAANAASTDFGAGGGGGGGAYNNAAAGGGGGAGGPGAVIVIGPLL